MSIDPCKTWECANSFANWFSAIGTIAISGLAVWLSVRDRLINLKVDLTTGFVPGADPSLINQAVFILEYVNVGPRPVTITNHAWKLPFKRGKIIMFPQLDPTTGRLCSRIPMELTDGKAAHTFYPIDFFQKRIDHPEMLFFPCERWRAWLRIHFFSVQVGTSTGRVVRVKIRSAVRKVLWQQSNAT